MPLFLRTNRLRLARVACNYCITRTSYGLRILDQLNDRRSGELGDLEKARFQTAILKKVPAKLHNSLSRKPRCHCLRVTLIKKKQQFT